MIKYSLTNKSEKIVIKIGSSLLINQNRFNLSWLSNFIDDVIFLIKKKKKIIIFACGAVSLGKKYLCWKGGYEVIKLLQYHMSM